jgi:hypothetical protein
LAQNSGVTGLSEELPEKAAELKADLKAWLESSGAKMPRPLTGDD